MNRMYCLPLNLFRYFSNCYMAHLFYTIFSTRLISETLSFNFQQEKLRDNLICKPQVLTFRTASHTFHFSFQTGNFYYGLISSCNFFSGFINTSIVFSNIFTKPLNKSFLIFPSYSRWQFYQFLQSINIDLYPSRFSTFLSTHFITKTSMTHRFYVMVAHKFWYHISHDYQGNANKWKYFLHG